MERFVDVPGGRLFCVDEGAGPAIVLLHAGIADLRAWEPVVPGLARAGFRVLRYDARGFGRSETAEVAFSNRADLIAVLDAAGVGRAAVVGNSRGGQIALDAAIEFPDRVAGLVTVGGGLGGFEVAAPPDEQALYDEGDRLEAADPLDVDATADFMVAIWLDGPRQPRGRVGGATREQLREMLLGVYAPRDHGRPIVLTPPANERLAELRCPVLAIAGALDFTDCAATARRIEAAAPNARAEIWPGVAHMVGLEAPDRLTGAIVEFLEPLRPWS